MKTGTEFKTVDTAKLVIGGTIAVATAVLNTVNVLAHKASVDSTWGAELQSRITTQGMVAGGISLGKETSVKWIDAISEAWNPEPQPMEVKEE